MKRFGIFGTRRNCDTCGALNRLNAKLGYFSQMKGLKLDDCSRMDWELERLYTETEAPFFAYPYADNRRGCLNAHLLPIVIGKGITNYVIGFVRKLRIMRSVSKSMLYNITLKWV